MATYLVTRPEHDDTTYYLSKWSEGTLKITKSRRIRVIDLPRERATREELEGMIKEFSPNLIVLNGHGDSRTVRGHNDKPLITAGKNEKILHSKIVYAISCKSAKELGPNAVKNGALSFTGYSEDFVFVFDPSRLTRPLSDATAELFLGPSIRFVESLIKGNNVENAHEKTVGQFRKNLIKALGNEEHAPFARYIWWDMNCFVSHGDKKARI